MKINYLTLPSCFALLASLAVIGCEQREARSPSSGSTTPPPTQTTPPNSGNPPGAQATRDAGITAEIHRALQADQTLSIPARTCNVTTADGVVTLKGKVPTQYDKDTIGALAAGVTGVVRVDNQLEVQSE